MKRVLVTGGAGMIGSNLLKRLVQRELAEIIVKVSGKEINIQYDITKPEGDKERCADCSKAEKVLGWKPKVCLKDGLRHTYQWIAEQVERRSA